MIPLTLALFFLLILQLSSSSKISISISPKKLYKSGDPVTIKWSGLDSPSQLDWLGIYSPPNSKSPHFIGYFFLSNSSTWQSGSGQITFPVINLRSNYQFRIFRWVESEIDPTHQDNDHNPLPGTKHLLAKSEELEFESGRGPEQVHLALTGRDGEMRVMFVSNDGKESVVKYGSGQDRLDMVVGTRVGRYEREHMCDSPANISIGWRDPGYIHDGVMVNLKKGVQYYYKVGSDSGGWSTTYNFVSHNGDSNETVAFLFGDMGAATQYSTFLRTQEESISTIKWIRRDIEALGDKPTFISHIGDISYARGYAWLWDTFFNQIEPVASKVPYHVCIGNHEYDWPLQPWKPDWASSVYNTDGGGECGVPYSLRFNMPGNSSELTATNAPATRNLYYSFDVGVVHFVYMSTETNFLEGSSQHNFIKHDLESADRNKTPFVVVQGHRPMYTTSNENKDAPLRKKMLEHLEPLFVKNKVTLALWGHVHRYERFCPINNYTCGTEALPVHVVIGMAGQDWQPIWEPRLNHPSDPVFPQPKRSMYRTGEFGYTRLHATKEKLTLSFVGNHDGKVHDVVDILASGQVAGYENGDDDHFPNGYLSKVRVDDNVSEPRVQGRSSVSKYVKGTVVLVVGAVIGYVLGFISRSKREIASLNKWTPVISEET
ncbi:putative inactive purple acid phosphatase 2 isoform X1 [Apium graveolens]|uniref:putative inactive purple acid phosphatase 2 isoform X1 n=1 Tax=Apium graveolens TaxID=4045 RepID=UPI003D7A1EE5